MAAIASDGTRVTVTRRGRASAFFPASQAAAVTTPAPGTCPCPPFPTRARRRPGAWAPRRSRAVRIDVRIRRHAHDMIWRADARRRSRNAAHRRRRRDRVRHAERNAVLEPVVVHRFLEFLRRLVAVAGLPRDGLVDDRRKPGIDVGRDLLHARRRLREDVEEDLGEVASAERQISRHGFVEDDADGVDVRAPVDVAPPARLLRRHVERRAHQRAGRRDADVFSSAMCANLETPKSRIFTTSPRDARERNTFAGFKSR